MDGDSRYRLFRNFMVNELSITRADIVQWVHEAIAAHIDRLVKAGEIKVGAMFERAIQREVSAMISDNKAWGAKSVQGEVADRVAARIMFAVREKGGGAG